MVGLVDLMRRFGVPVVTGRWGDDDVAALKVGVDDAVVLDAHSVT